MLVNIDVPDLAAAEWFYTHAFGFRAGRRLGESILEVLGASSPIYLIESPASPATANGALRRYDQLAVLEAVERDDARRIELRQAIQIPRPVVHIGIELANQLF